MTTNDLGTARTLASVLIEYSRSGETPYDAQDNSDAVDAALAEIDTLLREARAKELEALADELAERPEGFIGSASLRDRADVIRRGEVP